MLFALLAEETTTDTSSQILQYVFLGIIVVALIAMIVVNSRRNKKRQQEAENLINAVRPGNKVKTIGGICGIVVEVDDAENTFVLETGSETTGKHFIKFDKQAIYQTDAVATPAKEESVHETEDNAQETSSDVFEETTPAAEDAVKAEEPAEDAEKADK